MNSAADAAANATAPIALGVAGAAGRMGKAVLELASADEQLKLTAAIDAPGRSGAAAAQTAIELASADAIDWRQLAVLIDFSLPAGAAAHAARAAEAGCALVIGTTGLDAEQTKAVDAAAEQVALLHAPNMSLGVGILFRLVAQAARMLPEWDAEILELHHRAKVDAPSGTARRLGQIVQQLRPGSQFCTDRSGRRQARPDNEIGYAVLRGGDAIGEHTALFAGRGERIELTHRSTSRLTYAAGAIAAAKYLIGKKPGRYNMDDLLDELAGGG
ncbi:MAG: 4-hydroxy-tetrahydrodipicolinate reductase [Betaproteobacteria bacterium]|nr:4-hydroxy-tetrahydrodipicolinate reductase [Betaproteobacteria bacterium]